MKLLAEGGLAVSDSEPLDTDSAMESYPDEMVEVTIDIDRPTQTIRQIEKDFHLDQTISKMVPEVDTRYQHRSHKKPTHVRVHSPPRRSSFK